MPAATPAGAPSGDNSKKDRSSIAARLWLPACGDPAPNSDFISVKMKEGRATYRILDLDESERPRERLARLGAGALTDAERLAILLRVGVPGENAVQVGQRLLSNLGGLAGIHSAAMEDVVAEQGIGPAKAAQIKAAIELGRRLAELTPEDRPAIHSPQDAANLVLYAMGALEQEEMWLMVLDTRNRVLKLSKKYKGSVNSSQVRVGELFREAIQANAHAVILIHNHPSGATRSM